MQNWKKIVFNILWSLLGVSLIVLFVIAWQVKAGKKCTAIQVELVGESTKALFMNEQEILQILNEQGVKVGQPIVGINLTALEHMLENTGWIKNAELYLNNQLELQVKIEQRIPIARVFSLSGNSCYIDNEGRRLPLRQLAVMRLPVFTGFTSDETKLSVPDSALLKDIVHLANMIKTDSFYMAQVAQVNIAPNGDFELIPTLGDHTVLLGTMENIEQKLNRLYTFYKKVWVSSGINAYQVLDCRFDNQIVALKKGMQPIQFSGALLPFDNMIIGQDSVTNLQVPDSVKPKLIQDTGIKKLPVKSVAVVVSKPIVKALIKSKTVALPKKKTVQQAPKKMAKKLDNKQNNKSLNKVKKTAKALLPKKLASKTTTNN